MSKITPVPDLEKIIIIRCRKCGKRHEFECPKKCQRCGRNTHEIAECFAKKDLEGNLLEDI
jgi:hypothetical protein